MRELRSLSSRGAPASPSSAPHPLPTSLSARIAGVVGTAVTHVLLWADRRERRRGVHDYMHAPEASGAVGRSAR